MNCSELKFHILTPFKEGAYGGRVQFLKALRKKLDIRGRYESDYQNADILIFDSFPSGHVKELYGKVSAFKRMPGRRIVIHRVDGPISVVRGSVRDFHVDEAIRVFNCLISDGTVYQSSWSKSLCEEYGIGLSKPSVTIINAPDPDIFFPGVLKTSADGRISLVAASWSSNWRKGFDVYRYIDEYLDSSRYRFTFIGNCPFKFRHAIQVPPLEPVALAHRLRESDIYISASVDDPCSNSVLEARNCGLKLLLRNSGGHPELLDGRGVLFSSCQDVLSALDRCVDLDLGEPDVGRIDSVVDQYIAFSEEVYHSKLTSDVRNSDVIKLYYSALVQRYKPALTKRVSSFFPIRESMFYSRADVMRSVGTKANGIPSDVEDWSNAVVDRMSFFLNCMRHPAAASLYKLSYSSDIKRDPLLLSSVLAADIGSMINCFTDGDKIALIKHIESFRKNNGNFFDPNFSYGPRNRVAPFSFWGLPIADRGYSEAMRIRSFFSLKRLGADPSFSLGHASIEEPDLFRSIDKLNWKAPDIAIIDFTNLIFDVNERSGSSDKSCSFVQEFFSHFFKNYQEEGRFWYAKRANISMANKISAAAGIVDIAEYLGVNFKFDEERMIDICLIEANDGDEVSQFGIIRLLHYCAKNTTYKREEITEYMLGRLMHYQKCYWITYGGFSSNGNYSVSKFYGVRVATGMCEPDLCATKMVLYAIKLISEVLGWSLANRLGASNFFPVFR